MATTFPEGMVVLKYIIMGAAQYTEVTSLDVRRQVQAVLAAGGRAEDIRAFTASELEVTTEVVVRLDGELAL